MVGFQHRMVSVPDDPDEHFGWSEYLLYNRKRGFFLVDVKDGWSLVKPVTVRPPCSRAGRQSVGLTATPYHANVPNFGEWGGGCGGQPPAFQTGGINRPVAR